MHWSENFLPFSGQIGQKNNTAKIDKNAETDIELDDNNTGEVPSIEVVVKDKEIGSEVIIDKTQSTKNKRVKISDVVTLQDENDQVKLDKLVKGAPYNLRSRGRTRRVPKNWTPKQILREDDDFPDGITRWEVIWSPTGHKDWSLFKDLEPFKIFDDYLKRTQNPDTLTKKEWIVKKIIQGPSYRSDDKAEIYEVLWDTDEKTWETRQTLDKTKAFGDYCNEHPDRVNDKEELEVSDTHYISTSFMTGTTICNLIPSFEVVNKREPEYEDSYVVDGVTHTKVKWSNKGSSETRFASQDELDRSVTEGDITMICMDENNKSYVVHTEGEERHETVVGIPAKTMARDIKCPFTLKDALSGKHRSNWIKAICREIKKLDEFGTFEYVKVLPKGVKLIGHRWVFAIKSDAQGWISELRARLVCLGYSEIPWVMHNPLDCFSPTAQTATTLALIGFATRFGYKLWQSDISGAFLTAHLPHDLYMKVPYGGHDLLGLPKDVKAVRLVRALYGLKESSSLFFQKLSKILCSIGYTQHRRVDACLFTFQNRAGSCLLTCHVDDLVVVDTSKDGNIWLEHAKLIQKDLEMSVNTDAEYILGMKITRYDDGRVLLSQRTYTIDLLKRYLEGYDKVKDEEGNPDVKKMKDHGWKVVKNPLSTVDPVGADHIAVTEEDFKLMENIDMRSLVGALLYLARLTRIDILFATIMLARYATKASIRHWEEGQRILKYLANTTDKGIMFYPEAMAMNAMPLVGITDASQGVAVDNFESSGGYVFYLYGSVIVAKSWKLKVHVQSSTEAEYVAFSEASRDAIHLTNICRILGIRMNEPVPMCTDSNPVVSTVTDENFRLKYRQVATHLHCVKDYCKLGFIHPVKIHTNYNPADSLTKRINTAVKFQLFADGLLTAGGSHNGRLILFENGFGKGDISLFEAI